MAKRRESAAAERRRERWRGTARRWRASGLSQAEFCRRRGIRVSKFSWWKRRLRGEPIGPPGKFIPLGVLQRPSRARRLELVLANGRRLRFCNPPVKRSRRAGWGTARRVRTPAYVSRHDFMPTEGGGRAQASGGKVVTSAIFCLAGLAGPLGVVLA